MQALLEGVALRTAEVLAAMQALRSFNGPISVDGGLSRNGYFVQFLSEVAGHDLFLADEAEQTALGLAVMAAEALGLPRPDIRKGRILQADTRHSAARLAAFAAARRAIEDFATHQSRGE
jgi:glycerol kinase